jgi:hypothetical protein
MTRARSGHAAVPPGDSIAGVDPITHDGVTLGLIIRSATTRAATTFHTPPELPLQVGTIVYPAGGVIARHEHVRTSREVHGAPEVLIVERGRMTVEFFGPMRALVATREVSVGDVVVLLAGGHGFRVLEDLVLLEVKQGPFEAGGDKEPF